MSEFREDISFYTYPQYLNLVSSLVEEGSTTGDEPTESRIAFTKLNLQRMNRWDRQLILDQKLVSEAQHAPKQVWWVFIEAWCGDGAQSLPVLEKIAASSLGNIQLRLLLRDEHANLMTPYLTNGGKAIPKLVATDLSGEELFTWGPRPKPAQELMSEWRRAPAGRSFEDIEKELHLWYARNKGASVQQEILAKLNALSAVGAVG